MHICLNWLSLIRQSSLIRLYLDNELDRTDKPSIIPTHYYGWFEPVFFSICPRVSNLTKNWKGARTNLSSVFVINSFSFDKPFLIKLLQAGRQMQFFKPLYSSKHIIFKFKVRVRVDPDVYMALRLQIIQIHVAWFDYYILFINSVTPWWLFKWFIGHMSSHIIYRLLNYTTLMMNSMWFKSERAANDANLFYLNIYLSLQWQYEWSKSWLFTQMYVKKCTGFVQQCTTYTVPKWPFKWVKLKTD